MKVDHFYQSSLVQFRIIYIVLVEICEFEDDEFDFDYFSGRVLLILKCNRVNE